MEQFIFYDLYRDVSSQPSNRPKRAEGHAEKEQPDEKVALNNIFFLPSGGLLRLDAQQKFFKPVGARRAVFFHDDIIRGHEEEIRRQPRDGIG